MIGLLTVQILIANGCKVLAIDYDSEKCNLAKSYGAKTVDLSKSEDIITISNNFSKGRGIDAVLITASSKSNDMVMNLQQFFEKEQNYISGVIWIRPSS